MMRLLLVDDELALLKLIEQYLTRVGYAVESCSNSEEAWRLFQNQPRRYSLIFVDVSLPGISGEQLLVKMFSLNTDLRFLLSSGYPYNVQKLPVSLRANVGFLQKPFLPNALLESVENLTGLRPNDVASLGKATSSHLTPRGMNRCKLGNRGDIIR